MWLSLTNRIIQLRIHVIFALLGFIVLYLGMFEGLPNPASNWLITFRPAAILPLIWASIGFFIISITVTVFELVYRRVIMRSKTPKIDNNSNSPFIVLLTPNESLTNDEVTAILAGSSKTQQDILRLVYRKDTADQITLDDVFTQFQAKYGAVEIASRAEMFYRLRDLAHLRLLAIKPLAEKKSIVLVSPYIRNCFEATNFIVS